MKKILLFLVWVWIAGGALAAEPVARLDRTQVFAGEPVVLTLAVSGNVGGAPDFSALQQDFDLVRQGQSNRMSIINGRSSSSREWHLTLMPKRTGTITIPAIPFGTAASRPLTLEVLPAAQAVPAPQQQGAAQPGGGPQPVIVEVDMAPASPFVQQQMIYTVRLLYAVPLRDANLTDPRLDGALVYRLGDDSRFDTVRNGRQYRAVERRYAILPQRSGTQRITGPVLTARIPEPTAQQRGGSPLDRFFGGDPFSGPGGFFGPTRPVQARAPGRDVEVRPQPPGTSVPWLPAESLTLNEVWTPSPPRLRVGEPATRTLVITAQGLADVQLPEPALGQSPSLNVYPDKARGETRPDGNTLVAQKVVEAAIVPSSPGRLVLPEIALRWWDVGAGRERVARVPAREFDVLPAAAGAPAAAVPAPARPPAPATGLEGSTAAADTGVEAASASNGIWPWVTASLAIALLAVIGMWLRDRRRPSPAGRPAGRPSAASLLPKPVAGLARVRRAFASNDPRAARDALLRWAARTWPDEPPTGLDALARRLGPETDETMRQIDGRLYAQDREPWDGVAAWQRVEAALQAADSARRRERSPGSGALPPLHPGTR